MNENNNKKIVGTIIGVIFFVILIAGATFAWLSYMINVTNGTYNTKTKNFFVNYTSGQDINGLPMYYDYYGITDQDLYNDNALISISASLGNPDVSGNIEIMLHVNDTPDNLALISSECIKYAVWEEGNCQSNEISECADEFGILESSNLNINNNITLYSDALSTTTTDYNIGLWIDKELVTNNVIGLNFSGYIFAYATQSNSR